MTSLFTFRVGRRLVMPTLLLTCLFLYVFQQGNNQNENSNSMCHSTKSMPSSQLTLSWRPQNNKLLEPYYRDLNALEASSEHLLVLTPILKVDAINHLERYFELLDKSTYPNHLISVGILISIPSSSSEDQHQALLHTLTTLVQQFQQRWFNAFHDITIYQRDFHFDFDPADKQHLHSFDFQPYRRSITARARNYLLSTALQNHHTWVAWMDVDMVSYPTTIFEDLMRHDVDVIVPNCLLPTTDGSFWGYDRNNWQETDGSMRFQMEVGVDFVMVEGYDELVTGRTLMVDMPTHLGSDHLVPLDGIGASFTLVKANVHREGANFPSFAFQHQIDTEGFARMIQAMGYSIFGIPSYFVYHAHP
ncbi:unnamed protein product [Absidia cylindrospora]